MIKAKARDIGFDIVGITSAAPLLKAREVLEKRKEAGQLPGFTDEDILLSTTPRMHLEDARSIIALAMSYASKVEFDEEVYIALYARGKDYHTIMRNKMNELIDFIKNINPESNCKSFVDTGPLLDKEIAARAGLGWIGKNNLLINPEYGSFLVLGEILTSLELKYDNPIENGCKNCQACIQMCPTGALKPYYLDLSRCRSNITQKTGILSEEEKKAIGENLWGCDSCQMVCPYNENLPLDLHPEYRPVLPGKIEEVLGLTKKNMGDQWKNSPMMWRGTNIIKRNALINLVNLYNKGVNITDVLEIIKKGLKSPSPVVRITAAWAAGKIKARELKDFILKLLKSEKDKVVENYFKKVIKRLNQ